MVFRTLWGGYVLGNWGFEGVWARNGRLHMMFSRFVRTNDWFVMVDCFGGRRYRVEYKYIIPCWIGVVLGMVGLICGEVWGFGERE